MSLLLWLSILRFTVAWARVQLLCAAAALRARPARVRLSARIARALAALPPALALRRDANG